MVYIIHGAGFSSDDVRAFALQVQAAEGCCRRWWLSTTCS
jgi:hypothetical protein